MSFTRVVGRGFADAAWAEHQALGTRRTIATPLGSDGRFAENERGQRRTGRP
jgi:hypothetical protein